MDAAGNRRLLVMMLSSWAMAAGLCSGQGPFVVSSFSHPETWLRPYDWTYMRVEVPPWFSSVVITFISDVVIDEDHGKQLPKSRLPVICLKEGNPPLPDVSDSYLGNIFSHSILNYTFGGLPNLRDVEQCIPFQKNLTMTLTNEQMSPGIWYIGFFNGLGPARTQSKMISRGQAYMFRTSIKIEACTISTAWGPYCNQTIDTISCYQSSVYMKPRRLLEEKAKNSDSLNHHVENGGKLQNNYRMLPKVRNTEEKQLVLNSSMFSTDENLITCNNSYESSCLGFGEQKLYFLDIVGVAFQFEISATDIKFNHTSSVNNSTDGILLMCYARHNAMPLVTLHDYSADISRESLIVKSPIIGRWFIAIQIVNQTTLNKDMQQKYSESSMCFSVEWDVLECLNGKAGVNCTWELHMLQRVLRRSTTFPLDSYYMPNDENETIEKADFPLEYLLSNTSVDNVAWTYFFLDVPRGAAGATMHIQLVSDTNLDYEMYLRYGGIATIDTWDYYLNNTSSTNGSMFWAFSAPNRKGTDLYIVYAKEGLWCLGMKHPSDAIYKQKTTVSFSLEGCPRHCSSNGDCHYSIEESGSTFYSYCSCDRDHGGFDCSDELVSRKGHISQSVFLIASNVAALLPAYWALRQKAFSEWVLFTSSGISSALYHACDVGTWCPLSFHVLQFMDFWLSFMAVVSTFVYMTTLNEASKRAIHTSVAILTALLAVTGATRSTNIILVIAIGTLGLLMGWLLEFSVTSRSRYCPTGLDLLADERWQSIQRWFWNLLKTLKKRFRRHFVVLGFIFLAFAGTSWKLESNESYWIWHSLWHMSIYTSSFFFLCSTVTVNNIHEEEEYELTRQNSLPRTE